jgi:hypothetical protein
MKRAPLVDAVVVVIKPNHERIGFEVLIQSFIRKQLGLNSSRGADVEGLLRIIIGPPIRKPPRSATERSASKRRRVLAG